MNAFCRFHGFVLLLLLVVPVSLPAQQFVESRGFTVYAEQLDDAPVHQVTSRGFTIYAEQLEDAPIHQITSRGFTVFGNGVATPTSTPTPGPTPTPVPADPWDDPSFADGAADTTRIAINESDAVQPHTLSTADLTDWAILLVNAVPPYDNALDPRFTLHLENVSLAGGAALRVSVHRRCGEIDCDVQGAQPCPMPDPDRLLCSTITSQDAATTSTFDFPFRADGQREVWARIELIPSGSRAGALRQATYDLSYSHAQRVNNGVVGELNNYDPKAVTVTLVWYNSNSNRSEVSQPLHYTIRRRILVDSTTSIPPDTEEGVLVAQVWPRDCTNCPSFGKYTPPTCHMFREVFRYPPGLQKGYLLSYEVNSVETYSSGAPIFTNTYALSLQGSPNEIRLCIDPPPYHGLLISGGKASP